MDSASYLTLAFAAATVYIFWHFGGKALQRHLTQHFTVAYDIPRVGNERREDERIKGTAVVCGGR